MLTDPYDIILIRHLAYFQLGEAPLHQALCNLDRPEKSLLLRAPLDERAGGLGRCGTLIFEDATDPDYQTILATIRDAAKRLTLNKRFGMPGFRPNVYYVRTMQRYGVLPKAGAGDEPVSSYAADRAYWRSFTYVPRAQTKAAR